MARTQTGFQPMLAERKKPDLTKLKFPFLGSPKLDGIRCIIDDTQALSRKLKPLPNGYVQDSLRGLPKGLDGELIVGGEVDSRVWNGTQSGIMSRDGEPAFKFWIFDYVAEGIGFENRYNTARQIVEEYAPAYPWLRVVPHHLIKTVAEAEHYEEHYTSKGFEGLMLRSLDGPYKYGRSTLKEGYLLKLKRFEDAEAVVVGVVERMHNANEQERDERGYAKRSHAKAGKVGTDTLGAFVCRIGVCADGSVCLPGEGAQDVEFEIGTGFTQEDRDALWSRKDTDLIGSKHIFKFQGLTPDERKPRFPVWKGEWFALDK